MRKVRPQEDAYRVSWVYTAVEGMRGTKEMPPGVEAIDLAAYDALRKYIDGGMWISTGDAEPSN